MRRWRVVKALPEHIPPIARAMREADRREVLASHGHGPEEALRAGLACSDPAWTALIDGVPALMWGVGRDDPSRAPGPEPGSSRTGRPWLLGAELPAGLRREFLRQSRAYVDKMQAAYGRLENYAHAENRLSLRWLAWCGFTLERDAPVFLGGEAFFRFWRTA